MNSPACCPDGRPIPEGATRERVSLSMLRTDLPETQARAEGIRPDIVDAYAFRYATGGWLPEVEVYRVAGVGLVLVDGYHRVEAARRTWPMGGEVWAFVWQGDLDAAVLHAGGANAGHGLRREARDLQHAIENILRRPGLAKLSDREIARRCECSHPTVAKVRTRLEDAGVIPRPRTEDPPPVLLTSPPQVLAALEASSAPQVESVTTPPAAPRATAPQLLDKIRHLIGTIPDHEIATLAGVGASAVGTYRRLYGIPAYTPAVLDMFRDVIGELPDDEIALLAEVTVEEVRAYRERHDIQLRAKPEEPAAPTSSPAPEASSTPADVGQVEEPTGPQLRIGDRFLSYGSLSNPQLQPIGSAWQVTGTVEKAGRVYYCLRRERYNATPPVETRAEADYVDSDLRSRHLQALPSLAELGEDRDPRLNPRPHDVLQLPAGSLYVVDGWREYPDSVRIVRLWASGDQDAISYDLEHWRSLMRGGFEKDAILLQRAVYAGDDRGWTPPAGGYNYQLSRNAIDGAGWPRPPEDHLPEAHRLPPAEPAAEPAAETVTTPAPSPAPEHLETDPETASESLPADEEEEEEGEEATAGEAFEAGEPPRVEGAGLAAPAHRLLQACSAFANLYRDREDARAQLAALPEGYVDALFDWYEEGRPTLAAFDLGEEDEPLSESEPPPPGPIPCALEGLREADLDADPDEDEHDWDHQGLICGHARCWAARGSHAADQPCPVSREAAVRLDRDRAPTTTATDAPATTATTPTPTATPPKPHDWGPGRYCWVEICVARKGEKGEDQACPWNGLDGSESDDVYDDSDDDVGDVVEDCDDAEERKNGDQESAANALDSRSDFLHAPTTTATATTATATTAPTTTATETAERRARRLAERRARAALPAGFATDFVYAGVHGYVDGAERLNIVGRLSSLAEVEAIERWIDAGGEVQAAVKTSLKTQRRRLEKVERERTPRPTTPAALSAARLMVGVIRKQAEQSSRPGVVQACDVALADLQPTMMESLGDDEPEPRRAAGGGR